VTPRLFVCQETSAALAVLTELRAAQAQALAQRDVPVAAAARTFDDVTTLDDVEAVHAAVRQLVSGATVVAVAGDERLGADLYDQGRRLAPAEWYDAEHRPLCDGLEDVHVALLLAVRAGRSVKQAGMDCHLSERSASRRLAEVRTLGGFTSTADASVRVGVRIDELSIVAPVGTG